MSKSEVERLRQLYFEITKGRGKPLDFWEVAALLEIYGIRDLDAKREYGFSNVFELARFLFANFRESKEYPSRYLMEHQEVPPLKTRILRNFLKGLSFAMPMFLQIFFTIVFGFALWSNIHLDVTEATVIALGTFLALVVSGGMAQIIGRKGLYYLKMGEQILAGKIMEILLVQGALKILILALLITLFNQIFGIFSDYLLYLFLATFALLGLLFTISSIYYVFEEYEKILLFYLLGIGMVFLLHYLLDIDFPEAQFLGIAFLDLLFAFFAWRKIRQLKRSTKSEGEILPRSSMLIFTLLPFYIYGVLYFLFLIMDRLVAWNANSINRGLFVWFDVRYEIGSDLALLVLILLMGLVEVLVYEFLYKLNTEVFRYEAKEYRRFNDSLMAFYKRAGILFILYALGTIMVVSLFVWLLYTFAWEQLPLDGTSLLVFGVAAIAYSLLTFGLFNTLILFSFSRQGVVLQAIFLGLLGNFLVGVVLANMGSIYWAVFGLLVGSGIFCWVTTSYMLQLLKKLDYFYYSAF
ncbi:MAG: hypothetical protein C6I00_04640 [Nitratiruptor sp.]|nr:hypothetical protein [Nitratiruptor sp.]